MSQWRRVQDLSDNSKISILRKYEESSIPIEVRICLAQWIEQHFGPDEEQPLENEGGTVPAIFLNEGKAETFLFQLLQQIKNVVLTSSASADMTDIKLRNAFENFQEIPPLDLYQKFQTCLQMERQFLVQELDEAGEEKNCTKNDDEGCLNDVKKFQIFSKKLITLQEHSQKLKGVYDTIRQLQGDLELKMERQRDCNDQLQALEKRKNLPGVNVTDSQLCLDVLLLELQYDIPTKKKALSDQESLAVQLAQDMIQSLDDLSIEFVTEFMIPIKWSEQESACSLNNLQRCYKDFFEIMSILQNHFVDRHGIVVVATILAGVDADDSLKAVASFKDRLSKISHLLLSHALVVKEQPMRVMKLKIGFDTSVLLLCEKDRIGRSLPVIQISLLNEGLARQLKSKGKPTPEILKGCGSILNKKGKKMDTPSLSSSLTVEFKDTALSINSRAVHNDEINETKSVRAMSQKFCLLYSTKIKIDDISHELWCCSVPFVLYGNVSQRPEGWATIFWDKFFHKKNRLPFLTPESVPWSQFEGGLTKFFKMMTGTGWNLSKSNLKYIGCKFFKTTTAPLPDTPVHLESLVWKKNSKDKSFWDWIYAAMEFISKGHMTSYWDKGVMIGFIDRAQATKELMAPQIRPGTFLLRFSDTVHGAVSICYRNQNHGVDSVVPFTDECLKARGLAERIEDEGVLEFVYYYNAAGILRFSSKKEAFPILQQSGADDGENSVENLPNGLQPYKKCGLVMVIEGSLTGGRGAREQSYQTQAFQYDQSYLQSMDSSNWMDTSDSDVTMSDDAWSLFQSPPSGSSGSSQV